MTFYHCTHRSLKEGEIVTAGNWGNKLFEIGVNHDCWKREMALEAIRSWNFPDKPSRLKGTFVCETIEAIRFYRAHLCPGGYIYEVEPENNLRMHRGDFNAVQPPPNSQFNMWQIAEMYWRHSWRPSIDGWPNIEFTELIFDSSLKIIQLIPE